MIRDEVSINAAERPEPSVLVLKILQYSSVLLPSLGALATH
jgi:hypothetical protein